MSHVLTSFSEILTMKRILLYVILSFFILLPQTFAEIPANPTGVSLEANSNSITVTWTLNSDTITEGYYVSFWETGHSTEAIRATVLPTKNTYLITGLIDNREYNVTVAAYNGTDISSPATKTITTTSIEIDVELIDVGTIQVSLSQNYASVENYDLRVGTSSGADDTFYTTGIPADEAYIVDDLTNGTYYISVTVHYISEDTGTSKETVFVVDDFGTFFSQAGDIDNGCFIESSSKMRAPYLLFFSLVLMGCALMIILPKRLRALCSAFLILVLFSTNSLAEDTEDYKNLVGVKGGIFMPGESLQDDVYNTITPYSLFYERMFNPYFSADVSAGYCHSKGYAVTNSTEQTGVPSKLDLIPIAMSLNVNLPLNSLITFYMGAGGDYWIFDESSLSGDFKNEVGGWHGKAGFKLFTADIDYYKRGGILIEASYAAIDRFGKNDLDLGGWTYSLGVMYCF